MVMILFFMFFSILILLSIFLIIELKKSNKIFEEAKERLNKLNCKKDVLYKVENYAGNTYLIQFNKLLLLKNNVLVINSTIVFDTHIETKNILFDIIENLFKSGKIKESEHEK